MTEANVNLNVHEVGVILSVSKSWGVSPDWTFAADFPANL